MNTFNERTLFGKRINTIKDFIIDLRERLVNITSNINSITNKEVLFGYLIGAIVGIMNRLNRVCETDLQKIDIFPKFQHKNAKDEKEFVENLCFQTNFVFFSNFNLDKDSMMPSPKYQNLKKIIEVISDHFFDMNRQLVNFLV